MKTSVLFVCLGNICRSPLAEGIFRDVVEKRGIGGRFLIDSAGTGGWHVGSPPDPRSIEVAANHGIDLRSQRCRKITVSDFQYHDLVFGMDRSNVDNLRAVAPGSFSRIHMFLDYVHGTGVEIPDPYYGDADGFENVYQMIREGSEALADRLIASTGS